MNSKDLSFSEGTFPHCDDFASRFYFSLLDHFLQFLVDQFVLFTYFLFDRNVFFYQFHLFLLRKSFNLFQVLLHQVDLNLRGGGFCDFEYFFVGLNLHLFDFLFLVLFVQSFVKG